MISVISTLTPDLLRKLAIIHSLALPFQCWDQTSISRFASQPHHHLRIAMKDDSPIGFIVWRALLDEAELLTIAVDPTSQRAKAGTKLLETMLSDESLKPAKFCFLDVAADNDAAQQFYFSHGFSEYGRRRGYYRRAAQNAVDAVLMRRAF